MDETNTIVPIEPSNPYGYTPAELRQREMEAEQAATEKINREPGLREGIKDGQAEATQRVLKIADETHDSFERVALVRQAEDRENMGKHRLAA
ncbi:MAG TPA: hypothetical protein VI913_02695 [Candidatus Peribacteraceae bacterium]|nr:hypothetical protein [Candidatus Peribacteraceae bacterium]